MEEKEGMRGGDGLEEKEGMRGGDGWRRKRGSAGDKIAVRFELRTPVSSNGRGLSCGRTAGSGRSRRRGADVIMWMWGCRVSRSSRLALAVVSLRPDFITLRGVFCKTFILSQTALIGSDGSSVTAKEPISR
ncbi:hypothetical protein EYF80_046590 [Liparis tanakae]|uniref:Uncharacterized protein n=1 Tax=Liparis tanakae TaxID=230148 RepID=A0A4Z2FS55_9TELE|nr:hypothetical protein EYF80_046590 [Liparis tanakae]